MHVDANHIHGRDKIVIIEFIMIYSKVYLSSHDDNKVAFELYV